MYMYTISFCDDLMFFKFNTIYPPTNYNRYADFDQFEADNKAVGFIPTETYLCDEQKYSFRI